jgi:hypothetical protein
MTKNEIARLKERLRAEYERKLKAIEMVEQMLADAEPQGSPKLNGSIALPQAPTIPIRAVSPVPAAAVAPSNNPSTLSPSIEDQIETTFKGRSGWTVPEALRALALQEYQRGTVWNAVQRLVETGKVRLVQPGGGRRAATYAWAE